MAFGSRLRRLPGYQAAAIALAPLACAVLYLRDPADGGFYPPCPFRAMTGLDCPGCGTGRALHRVLHGNAIEAFDLNPLAMLMLPVLGLMVASSVASALQIRKIPRIRAPGWAIWALPAVVITFWIARNLPFAATAWMGSFR